MEMLTDQLPAFSSEQLDVPDICAVLRLAGGGPVALL